MPDAYNAPEKVCQICGQDCSHKPRAKDANGRYVCKECMERAKDAKLAREAPPPVPAAKKLELPEEANSYVLDIPEKPLEKGMVPCASCGKPKREDAVLCVQCGYDSRKNERRHVKVLKPEMLKGERGRRQSRVYIGPEMLTVVSMCVITGLFGLCFVDEMFVTWFTIAAAIQILIAAIAMIVTPFREGETMWGVVVLLQYCIPFAGIAVLYYIWFVTDSMMLKLNWVASVLILVLAFILQFNGMMEGGLFENFSN